MGLCICSLSVLFLGVVLIAVGLYFEDNTHAVHREQFINVFTKRPYRFDLHSWSSIG